MRFFLLLVLTLSASSSVFAQKIRSVKAKHNVVYIPSQPQGDSVDTYSIEFGAAEEALVKAGFSTPAMEKLLKLYDYQLVIDGGELVYHVKASPLKVTEAKYETYTSKSKNKDGTETVTKTYGYSFKYSAPTTVRLANQRTNALVEASAGTDVKAYSIKEGKYRRPFTTMDAAKKAVSAQLGAAKKQLHRVIISEALTSAGKKARALIDSYETHYNHELSYGTGKKVSDGDIWEKHATEAAAQISAIAAREPLTAEVKARFQPHLDFWTAQAAKYSPDEKKERKLHRAAAHNLVTVYYILEEFDKIEPYRSALPQPSARGGYDTSLLGKVDRTKKRLEHPRFSTRHFPARKLDGARGFAVKKSAPALLKSKPLLTRTFDTLAAYVVRNGQRVEGSIVRPQQGATYKDGKRNIKFYATNGEEIALHPSKVSAFGTTDGKTEVITKMRGYGKTGLKKRPVFYRVVEPGDKIRLIQVMKTYADQDPINTDFLEIMDEKNDMISLDFSNIRWLNWRKAFAEIFHDCEVLYAEIRVGKYKNNLVDVRDALRSYRDQPCN